MSSACGRVAFDARDGASCVDSSHDEDGDGIGDACDPCPLTPIATGDRDGDGVGDACDPEPDLARQRFALFETFVAPSGWDLEGTLVGDGVFVAKAGGNLIFPMTVNDADIEVRGEIRSVDATAIRQFFVAIDRDADNSWYAELYEQQIDPLRFTLLRQTSGAYSGKDNQPLGGTLGPTPFALRFGVRVASGAGTASLDLPDRVSDLAGTFTEDNSDGVDVRIFTQGMEIEVKAITLVETIPH